MDDTYFATFVMDIKDFLLENGKKKILKRFQNSVMGFVFFMCMLYAYAKIFHKELMENCHKVKTWSSYSFLAHSLTTSMYEQFAQM